MATGVSIASEYGKLQDLWRNIERDEEWRLVIWNAQVEDMDIIDKFMEIERSPAGEFTDIFFVLTHPIKVISRYFPNRFGKNISVGSKRKFQKSMTLWRL